MKLKLFSLLFASLLAGCNQDGASEKTGSDSPDQSISESKVDTSMISSSLLWADRGEFYNLEGPIPPQCYTRTEGKFNPCFTCHQTYPDRSRPNDMDDGYLQGQYDFSEVGVNNHWKNLFVDRSQAIEELSDEFILEYISEDNYSALYDRWEQEGSEPYEAIGLKHFGDAEMAFDDQGFALDHSGWIAFNYKPFASTFWPTNGSTDDVVIRLPEAFRNDTTGAYCRDVYRVNLALLEMNIQRTGETLLQVDETQIGLDLDGDGNLGMTSKILQRTNYVGQAQNEEVVDMLYPLGTEFLHSVRYVGVDDQGNISPSPRMKELRYMKKTRFMNANSLNSTYDNERGEKIEGQVPYYPDFQEQGLYNGFGWMLLGYIEDRNGELRQQTKEETYFCMGCHTSIGSTIDQTFAFPRKVSGEAGWKYLDLKGMKDAPNVGSDEGEFLQYFHRVGGGDEFRQNDEMLSKWFDEQGSPKEALIKQQDVYSLITPSRERALKLNKAYYSIVRNQSFIFGRDANIKPAKNVYSEIDTEIEPLDGEHRYEFDIRLDWSKQ
ncbi:hypothetical protein [Thiomicrorhabdus sp.]|uniref:hypothetical protein n=1 Tax=Thiomicrorhabdus sp. TaxID=2039724 RepID=UPI0029C8BB1F|nr:hypothetical protein [Thiomicrorhabdus sp.]